MNYADTYIAKLATLGLVMVLSGCIVFEQTAGVSNKGRRVLFQNQYSAYYELQELSRFTKELAELGSEQFEQLSAEVKADFDNDPNMLNRYKLIMLLAHSGGDAGSSKRILSLIRDGKSEGSQSERFLAFIGEQYSIWIKRNEVLDQETQLQRTSILKLEKQNKALTKQLAASKNERNKLESQLTQLKSIETSIIKRDMHEGTATP